MGWSIDECIKDAKKRIADQGDLVFDGFQGWDEEAEAKYGRPVKVEVVVILARYSAIAVFAAGYIYANGELICDETNMCNRFLDDVKNRDVLRHICG